MSKMLGPEGELKLFQKQVKPPLVADEIYPSLSEIYWKGEKDRAQARVNEAQAHLDLIARRRPQRGVAADLRWLADSSELAAKQPRPFSDLLPESHEPFLEGSKGLIIYHNYNSYGEEFGKLLFKDEEGNDHPTMAGAREANQRIRSEYLIIKNNPPEQY